MASKSEKMGFNIFLDTDVVDFELINENFNKLENAVICMESGTKTSSYTGGVSGSTTWRYKKFSDGTIEMSVKMEFEDLRCNIGQTSPYYSSDAKVYFPFNLSSVTDVQMHLASNTIGWVSDITGKGVLDHVLFRVMATAKENNYEYKQVFINVKGVLS